MKKTILTEIKSEDLAKLTARLNKEQKEFSELYLQLKINKLKNIRELFHKRKLISRILTIINEKRSKK